MQEVLLDAISVNGEMPSRHRTRSRRRRGPRVLVISVFAVNAGRVFPAVANELVLYDGRPKGKGLFRMQVTQRA
jgi:hypothetical protein